MAASRRVRTAEFVCAAHTVSQLPAQTRPEIAFAGRSNVGKSSLLNALTGRKSKVAKVSRTPGKTQSINYFDINGELYWVDLPGYGYARVSKKLRTQWGRLISEYLEARKTLQLVVCLSDSRRPPTELDRQLVEWLEHLGIPWIGVLTKADKLKQSQRVKGERNARSAYGASDDHPLLMCSATTGRGLDRIWPYVLPEAKTRAAG